MAFNDFDNPFLNLPAFREPYNHFWLSPAESRKLNEARRWKVVAHQTRNVSHVGHNEEGMRCSSTL